MDNDHETRDVSNIDNPEVGHENRDVNVRIVVGFAAALVIAGILVLLFVWLIFDVYGSLETRGYPPESPLVRTGEIRLPPSPRLQDKPREDLKVFRKQEDDLLNSYTWINQETGAVRVPIWQAMDQVMQQGFPVAEQPSSGHAASPQDSSSGRTPEAPVKR